MSEKNSLVIKLAEVMKRVKYIEKRGFNKFHKYSYATESDVSDAIREILAEQNVIMLPDVIEHEVREHTNRHNNIEYISTVKIKFTFVDGESGESLSIHSVGEGQDAGDKGVYKAITGATKYALMKAFMIPTGDDPEADSGVDDRNNQNKQPNKASDKQLEFVTSLISKKTDDKNERNNIFVNMIKELKLNQKMTEWTSQQASQAIKHLQSDAND